MTTFTLRIPGLPPTTNNAFVNGAHGRHLSSEAKAFKEMVQWTMLKNRQRFLSGVDGLVSVTLTFYSEKWFTKAGTPRKIDLCNLEKLFVDAVFEQLGMEDSSIFRITMFKLVGPESSVIEIHPMEDLTTSN